jgi:hypothetical protein
MEHNRKKVERTQISVRIETKVLNMAYRLVAQKKQKITDVIEDGIFLAVQAAAKEGPVTERTRYLVSRATPEEQWFVHHLLGYLRMPLDNPVEELERKTLKEKLTLIADRPSFRSAIKTFGAFKAATDAEG